MSSVFYSELCPAEFKKRVEEAPIAYVPLGTLEWHGEHLPLGSDGLQSKKFFEHLAKRVGGIVLPEFIFGPEAPRNVFNNYYGMDVIGFPEGRPEQLVGSAYYMPTELFEAVLENTLKQLKRAGFKIIVAHGHGPSVKFFQQKSKEWGEKYSLILMDCWNASDTDPLYGIQTDHAAANETSLMMAMYPNLVHMENLDSDLNNFPIAVKGKDPRIFASSETGMKAIELQVSNMTKRLAAELKVLDRF